MRRRERLTLIQQNTAEQRAVNKVQKDKERLRRDARMIERVKGGSLPYTPDIMSWLSVKLGKRATRITPEDIANLRS